MPIPYRVTAVRFMSSGGPNNTAEYEVTLAGTSEPKRVTVERNGAVHMGTYGITAAQERECIGAVVTYLAGEHEKYVRWAMDKGFEVEPARQLHPVYKSA